MFEGIKIRGALLKHQKGDTTSATAVYNELYSQNYIRCSYILPWSVLLLRTGGEENWKKVKEMLAKAQKAPDISDQNRAELILNFAIAEYKLGNLDKAVELLERVHQKSPSGDTYGALGCLYIEQGNLEKAMEINNAALEYDDEDPIALDNMGQTYYRLLNDEEAALPYFKKAHEIKPSQIDTLWFLSRYDVKEGKVSDAIEKLETALGGRFSPLNTVTKAKIEEELASLKKQV